MSERGTRVLAAVAVVLAVLSLGLSVRTMGLQEAQLAEVRALAAAIEHREEQAVRQIGALPLNPPPPALEGDDR